MVKCMVCKSISIKLFFKRLWYWASLKLIMKMFSRDETFPPLSRIFSELLPERQGVRIEFSIVAAQSPILQGEIPNDILLFQKWRWWWWGRENYFVIAWNMTEHKNKLFIKNNCKLWNAKWHGGGGAEYKLNTKGHLLLPQIMLH